MHVAIDFDPTAPLPGPPDPWASTNTPSRRDGPPFHMTDMIAAEPAIAARIVAGQAGPTSTAAVLAGLVTAATADGTGVIVTGCGTSEHGALAVVDILREAVGTGAAHLVRSEQAFELAQDAPSSGLVIGISHEGATTATNAALAAARSAGAGTALITVSRRSPGAALADVVVETGELDQSWCHTVGYLSPIAAGMAVAGQLQGRVADADAIRDLVAAGLEPEPVAAADRIAAALAGVDRLLVLATGADRPAGRELVLKVEEGAWLPAAFRDLETFLHGHLAATDERTGLVAILTDRRGRGARDARLAGALRAARVIGMPTAAILASDTATTLPDALTVAGRIVLPEARADVPAAAAALLGTATALQTLTERLARARGVNPDPIHRDVDRYRAAAETAD